MPIAYQGKPAVQVVIRDITQRKKAMDVQKESEERLRTILDSVQAGIMIIDAETHVIVDANPVAIEMVGAPKEEIVGHVCHGHVCPAEEGHCPITDLGQVVDRSERVLLTANGKKLSVLKTVTPVVLGGSRCLLETFIDIDRRKKAEKELEKRLSDLERMHKAFVGRELRMKELKEEIKELKERLREGESKGGLG